MKRTRITMAALSLMCIASFVLMAALSESVKKGSVPDDWIGVAGLLMVGSVIANVVLAYRYAWKTGRPAAAWALGSLFFPYVAPVLLAFLSPGSGIEIRSDLEPGTRSPAAGSAAPYQASSQKKERFAAIPVPDRIFVHKDGLFSNTRWPLDQLRLFSVIVPGNFKWRVVATSQERDFYIPDLLPADAADALYGFLDDLLSRGNPTILSGLTVCLADYQNNGAALPLGKLRKESGRLLAGLYRYRNERAERLRQWLAGGPQVVLRGGFGSTAVLNREGFHLKKAVTPWTGVGRIETETTNNIITHLYVLPRGYSGGVFDFKKMKHALAVIPTGKKDLYATECFFWKTLSSLQS